MRRFFRRKSRGGDQYDRPAHDDSDGSDSSGYRLQNDVKGIFRENGDEGFEMSVTELLYSASSFYAIVLPGKETM